MHCLNLCGEVSEERGVKVAAAEEGIGAGSQNMVTASVDRFTLGRWFDLTSITCMQAIGKEERMSQVLLRV